MKPAVKSDELLFSIGSYFIVSVFTILSVIPFLLVLSGSLTDEGAIISNGYGFLPVPFSLDAYAYILSDYSQILRSYGVSIIVTLVGTAAGLYFCTMTAFVLSRQDFRYRNRFSFFFYFTTLFNGGLVSTYILFIQYLKLKNNLLSLILPGLLPVFYLLIMRSFIRTMIPASLIEAAKIDGAGEFRIFMGIVLPLVKPALACIGLFYAIGYWNDWYNAMLYITDIKKYSLQYLLTSVINKADFLTKSSMSSATVAGARESLPSESLKLAMTIVSIGPIVFVYPFVQKYFVTGLTIGAVKG